jgi:pyruvate-ferredoxin/flavodoxin oxidoreductase
VGANKNTIKIIGETTPKYCQAYFAYDSKKSGGFTCSHLRFGDHPINSPYLVTTPDFVACHVPSYLSKYDILRGIKPGGTLLLNSLWDAEETKNRLPDFVKRTLAEKKINFYIINATKIAEEIGLGNRTNTILQAAFFNIANIIPFEQAVKEMKKAIDKSYGKKGEDIVKLNYAAVDRGSEAIKVDVPEEWVKYNGKFEADTHQRLAPEWIKHVADTVNAQNGDDLPVSAFLNYEDGTMPSGSAAYEKRGIAVNVPEWTPEHCIQCNQCAYVCPHAAIRPFLLTGDELANVPAGELPTMKGNGPFKEYNFRIQVSPLDCTGCGNCVNTCPAKTKAINMQPFETQAGEQVHFDYLHANIGYKDAVQEKTMNVKNSQFAQPLFEFSGACAGCGETPYIKTITQLFGDRMLIANATGCSSIYGGSFPASPYCSDKNGRGPAWANSLFEDNAEFGFGMRIAEQTLRSKLIEKTKKLIAVPHTYPALKAAAQQWLDTVEDGKTNTAAADAYIAALQEGLDVDLTGTQWEAEWIKNGRVCRCEACTSAREILDEKNFLNKKSVWIFGGDGWAYDIGYGGLDHVLASGANVNVLVLDTEVYSNTGGQSSKSTPMGAVAKFATAGNRVRKKDLGMMAMSYGYVYVAQVAMGASQAQFFNVLKEAEAYNGPSLIIAYAPCISHGLHNGMGSTQREEKLAVDCGYWHLYRYNPLLETEGKNPFSLDSKEPDWAKFQDFLHGEVRYTSLLKTFPDEATELFRHTEEFAKWRYNSYKRLATSGN